jgi:hypothetical protein
MATIRENSKGRRKAAFMVWNETRNRLTPESVILKSHYFNFTNSKTNIAQIPTVTGNCTNCASCTAPPLGSKNVKPNIASAVSTPKTNFVIQFMVVSPFMVFAAPREMPHGWCFRGWSIYPEESPQKHKTALA